MIGLNREKFFSAPGLFILYVFFSSLSILGFRLISPGEAVPLENFSTVWHLLRGVESIIFLFPCLILSALVIPFMINPDSNEKFTRFSPAFLKKVAPSVLTAITASAIYALLFLLALPMIANYKTNLEQQARLYNLSLEKAYVYADQGDWQEVASFVDICERIWPGSPRLSSLATEVSIRLQEMALRPVSWGETSTYMQTSAGPESLTVTEALAMAEAAMREERFYDAHWLATLAGDIAAPGSIEAATASSISSRAWDAVSSLQPTSRESEAYRIYRLKRDAYRDLIAGEYISAYYLFLELMALSPNDPEGSYYLALCEEGLTQISFFFDEMELRNSPLGALYSIPYGRGRIVMRFYSISVSLDSAYGIDLEMLHFDRDGRLLWRIEAPYAKIVPLSLDSGEEYISIIMRTLDRTDGNRRWEPIKEGFAEAPPPNSQLTLSIVWEDFLLLTQIRRGQISLSPAELMEASSMGSKYGYMPSIFEAELINRFARPVLFLPLSIFVIIFGWRFRAFRKSRFVWLPMLGVLPLVFSGVVQLGRISLNNLTLWVLMNMSFASAIVTFAVGSVVLLFASLIFLASQRT
jgi:hypothetical protein